MGKSEKMTPWHTQNHFFPGGLIFNLASVKNNHSYEKKYFECVFGCRVVRVRNITGRASTLDTTVDLRVKTYDRAFGLIHT